MWPGPPVTSEGDQASLFQKYESNWTLQDRKDKIEEWLDSDMEAAISRPQVICGESSEKREFYFLTSRVQSHHYFLLFLLSLRPRCRCHSSSLRTRTCQNLLSSFRNRSLHSFNLELDPLKKLNSSRRFDRRKRSRND